MVKRRIQPGSCVVALITTLWEVRSYVIRIRGSLIILKMATHARVRGQLVIVIHVAIRALPGRHGMHARQGERRAVVIEGGIRPRNGVMALVATLREVRRDVVRIRRSLVILQVAGYASRAAQVVAVVDVAVGAQPRRNGVAIRQREPNRIVIERGI